MNKLKQTRKKGEEQVNKEYFGGFKCRLENLRCESGTIFLEKVPVIKINGVE